MNPETTTLHTVPSLAEIAAETPSAQHAHVTTWTVNVVRKAMNDGALVPGMKLSEQHISETLGISRNTLRQAFMILSQQNLVEQIPNRGVFVIAPGKEQIREMFTVRQALEGAAIDLAPTGPQPGIRDILKRSQLHRENGSVSGMASANQDFHKELVHLVGSPRLDIMMSSVLAEMRLLFFSMETVPSFHAPFVDLNEELLTLIERGEKEQAHTALRAYLKISQQNFAENLEAES